MKGGCPPFRRAGPGPLLHNSYFILHTCLEPHLPAAFVIHPGTPLEYPAPFAFCLVTRL